MARDGFTTSTAPKGGFIAGPVLSRPYGLSDRDTVADILRHRTDPIRIAGTLRTLPPARPMPIVG